MENDLVLLVCLTGSVLRKGWHIMRGQRWYIVAAKRWYSIAANERYIYVRNLTMMSDHRNAPVNAFGYLRVMFTVEDLDDTLARLYQLGAELVDEVVQFEDAYRLCYIRGPEGILIGLAQELGPQTS